MALLNLVYTFIAGLNLFTSWYSGDGCAIGGAGIVPAGLLFARTASEIIGVVLALWFAYETSIRIVSTISISLLRSRR